MHITLAGIVWAAVWTVVMFAIGKLAYVSTPVWAMDNVFDRWIVPILTGILIGGCGLVILFGVQ